ncbi:hypothetical protein QSV08_09810 [Maribacter sp. BPC-D8]|uniref:hypothetical protein n=1 Tax=Maribacter sp. BPC-D8 TaxID=3053613 RepID=UPI002B4951F4|nr:hypothetical protein [Maribacter sp. BPC-D8]WRI31531.1 hypothetical protein QSV08_09810 [Maribacter sp. BPC-D8]
MSKIEYYREALTNTEHIVNSGFGVSECKKWLKNIELISDFNEIETLFKNEEDLNKFRCLQILLQDKFNSPMPMNSYLNKKNVPSKLDLKQKTWFDITDYSNSTLDFVKTEKLKSLNIVMSRIKHLDITNLPNLQSLTLMNLRNINSFSLGDMKNIKYLRVGRCPNLVDFSVFEKAKDVLWVIFDTNRHLSDISFMKNYQKIVCISITGSEVFKNPNTVEILQNIKTLKFLNIMGKGTKKHRKIIAEALPDCLGNIRY